MINNLNESVEAEGKSMLPQTEMDDSMIEIDQNKSMMDVVPSANYKKLLHDFSNI